MDGITWGKPCAGMDGALTLDVVERAACAEWEARGGDEDAGAVRMHLHQPELPGDGTVCKPVRGVL
jgi:hypothetical protein